MVTPSDGPDGPYLPMWLVLLETSGNQSYIFDTNRRRENVGASHLIASLGDWTGDALASLGLVTGGTVPHNAQAEVLTTAAGRVQVLVTDEAKARQLVATVTRTSLRTAPGLDVCGVVVRFAWSGDPGDPDEPTTLSEATRRATALVPAVRAARPAQPSARFPRLPIVENCRSSSLPAAALYDPVAADTLREAEATGQLDRLEKPEPRSAFSLAKLAAVDGAYNRLAGLLHRPVGAGAAVALSGTASRQARRRLERIADALESEHDWLGVIHADGNGLGEIFRGLGAETSDRPARDCAEIMRAFSEAVEQATKDAYLSALDELVGQGRARPRDDPSPGTEESVADTRFRVEVLPLILAGDDLTVVCEGRVALAFTAAYLRAFEHHTREQLSAVVAAHGLDPERGRKLTAKAGVAIVKRSYPFSSAYSLAESLMDDEARQVKTRAPGASGLAFHVLYDTAAADLGALRGLVTVDRGTTSLSGQPYVVTTPDGEWRDWAARHCWATLLRQTSALQRSAQGREGRALPRAQTHQLRAGMQIGSGVADARFQGMWSGASGRYDTKDLADISAPGSTPAAPTLFFDDPGPDAVWRVTTLLDALDATDFLHNAEELLGLARARGEEA